MTNPYAPPQAIVQDVLDPAAGIVLADRGTRLGASLLDGLIFGVMVYLPLLIGMFASGGFAQAASGEDIGGAGLGVGFALAGLGFIAWVWLTVKYLKANGQSIGKKACRIKVVRGDGSPVSVSRVIWLRNVINMLLGILPMYGMIDVLFIFGDARRCVHDRIADTIVVNA